jgi:TetR/AcrR family tetracycline transcriptional repressor
MAKVTPPPGKLAWQAWITELFRRCRAAVRRHPNVAQLLGAQLVSNGSLPIELVEGVLAALTEAGFEGEPLLEAYNCVIAAMLGFLTMEFSPLPADNTQAWAEELRERVHTIRPLDHPVLTRNLPLLANKAFILRWDNGTTVPLDSQLRAARADDHRRPGSVRAQGQGRLTSSAGAFVPRAMRSSASFSHSTPASELERRFQHTTER